MKQKSIWLASFVHYLIGGLFPLVLLFLVGFKSFSNLSTTTKLLKYSIYNHILVATILIIIFVFLYWISTKVSSNILKNYFEKKNIIILISGISFGLTIFLIQIVAFWMIQNNLPDYAKMQVNLFELYYEALQPAIIILFIFVILSFLNFRKNETN